jgi:hypothetical protein
MTKTPDLQLDWKHAERATLAAPVGGEYVVVAFDLADHSGYPRFGWELRSKVGLIAKGGAASLHEAKLAAEAAVANELR